MHIILITPNRPDWRIDADHTRLRVARIEKPPSAPTEDPGHLPPARGPALGRRGGHLPQPHLGTQQHRPGHGLSRNITRLEDAGLQLGSTQLDSHSTVYELDDQGTPRPLVCRHCGRIRGISDPRWRGWCAISPGNAASRWFHHSLNALHGGCGCRRNAPAFHRRRFRQTATSFLPRLSLPHHVTAKRQRAGQLFRQLDPRDGDAGRQSG